MTTQKERMTEAVRIGIRYGQTDGGHHKMWVIDQMIRALTGDNYDKIIEEACKPEDGDEDEEVDEWDCGVAP